MMKRTKEDREAARLISDLLRSSVMTALATLPLGLVLAGVLTAMGVGRWFLFSTVGALALGAAFVWALQRGPVLYRGLRDISQKAGKTALVVGAALFIQAQQVHAYVVLEEARAEAETVASEVSQSECDAWEITGITISLLACSFGATACLLVIGNLLAAALAGPIGAGAITLGSITACLGGLAACWAAFEIALNCGHDKAMEEAERHRQELQAALDEVIARVEGFCDWLMGEDPDAAMELCRW